MLILWYTTLIGELMKKRICNVFSLIFNMLIVFFICDAIYYNFRTDITRDDAWFGFVGLKSLRFFTNLSNIFAGIVGVIIIFYVVRNLIKDRYYFPNWLINIKYVATVAVGVTFFTVVFFLAPAAAGTGKGYFSLFTGNNFSLHFLSPVLAMISFIFFERGEKTFGYKQTFWGLIPTVAYSIVYFIMVLALAVWPDFYGFTFNGQHWMIPIFVLVMYGSTYVLCVALMLCHRGWIKKHPLEN